MYLWANKYLNEPAHTRNLIYASAFLPVLYIVRRSIFKESSNAYNKQSTSKALLC